MCPSVLAAAAAGQTAADPAAKQQFARRATSCYGWTWTPTRGRRCKHRQAAGHCNPFFAVQEGSALSICVDVYLFMHGTPCALLTNRLCTQICTQHDVCQCSQALCIYTTHASHVVTSRHERAPPAHHSSGTMISVAHAATWTPFMTRCLCAFWRSGGAALPAHRLMQPLQQRPAVGLWRQNSTLAGQHAGRLSCSGLAAATAACLEAGDCTRNSEQ